MMDTQKVLLQWFIYFSIKETSGSAIKSENISDQQLAEELRKPIIRRLNKRQVHLPSIDNIWGANHADMQLISKFDKEIRFL